MKILGFLLALGVAGCGGSAEHAKTLAATATSCPDGWIMWNFATSAPALDNSEALASNPDAGAPIRPQGMISIFESDCDGHATSDDQDIKVACDGAPTCSYTPGRKAGYCTGSFTVQWTCGVGDVDPTTQEARVYTKTVDATNQSIAISCKSRATPTQVEAKSACVPLHCPAQSHRDADLNCVADMTKPVMNEGALPYGPTSYRYTGGSFYNFLGATYKSSVAVAKASASSTPDRSVILQNEPYDVRTSLKTSSLPQNVKTTIWMADRFRPNGVKDPTQEILGFRCVVGTFGNGVDHREGMLPKICTDPSQDSRVAHDAARRAGLSDADFAAKYTKADTVINESFDVEGAMAYVPFNQTLDTACAPNPLAFFYDSATGDYDYVGYYNQNSFMQSYNGDNYSYSFGLPSIIKIGPTDFAVRTASVEVAQFSPFGPTIPVDVSWYMSGDTYNNPFSLTGTRIKDGKHSPGDAWTAHDPQGSYAPPNLRAEIYMWPDDQTAAQLGAISDMPLVGSIPLTTPANPTGSTTSGQVRIGRALKKQLLDPSSPLYLGTGANPMRTYDLMYCVASDAPQELFDIHPWKSFTDSSGTYRETRDQSYYDDATNKFKWGFWVANASYDANGKLYNPWTARGIGSGLTGPGAGCVWSKTPVVIKLDRHKRSLQPIDAQPFDGISAGADSGSSTMAANQDADTDATSSADGKQVSNMDQTGLTSSGEFAKTYFAVTNEASIDKTSGASIDFTGEILGYTVFDGLAEKTSWAGQGGPPSEFTLKIEPPWDPIVDEARKAFGYPELKWEKGTHVGGGASGGLSVGWGEKIPVTIGPVPGLITVSVSVAVGTDFTATFSFAPEEDYPCEGQNAPCLEAHSELVSQAQAAQSCYVAGGRLAEANSATEAQLLHDTATTGGAQTYWTGGEVAYLYPLPSAGLDCSENFDSSRCLSGSQTSYRWLSTDDEFATATGTGAVTWDNTKVFGVSTSGGLSTPIPNLGGVAYSPSSNSLSTVGQSTALPYICEFDPADSTDYFKWKLALEIGASAGVGIEFCTPTDDVGVCLEGSVDFVGVHLEPQYSQSKTTLYDSGGNEIGTRENVNKSVPWDVTVLEATIEAEFKLYLLSFAVEIFHFDGFQLAGGTLYNIDFPTIHNL